MPFVKVQKNKAYYKRYQTKYRRRREGKTDYRARKRLVVQDKNKYSAPRYRLVVRITNHFVIAQIVHSEIKGDYVLASAYSSELARYGLSVGLKNYAAAYCTGLLVARRVLAKLGLDKAYKGNEKVTGEVVKSEHTSDTGRVREFWVAKVDAAKKPFRAVLDVGTRATTTGARVFGVLKGASDGGIDIPHNNKRFPGYNREAKEYKPAAHRERIFGGHISTYMTALAKSDPDTYAKRFSAFIKAGVNPSGLEALYTKVHKAIRADPSPAPKKPFTKKPANPARRTLAERKAAVAAKMAARAAELRSKIAAGGDEDDE
jgi:large subunit ribosomal protein L5e